MRVYFIYDKKAQKVIKTKTAWCYSSLGSAKTAAKNYLASLNKKKKPRDERFFWYDYEIIECDPVELQRHKV